MTRNTEHKLERLEQVLDAFGPESERWPESERSELSELAGSDIQGRRLLAEAKALAQAMDTLPQVSASDALKARIVAAAVNDPARDARVIPISAGAKPSPQTVVSRPYRSVWPVAALAASFALGVYLGVAGIGGQTFESAVQISGLNGGAGDSDGIVWLEDGSGPEGML